jgi:hypothetical protein
MASFSIFPARSAFSSAMAACEAMPASTLRSFSENAFVRSRVSQNRIPLSTPLDSNGTAMADRMPWATIDSDDEKRESRMASAVSTALRVSATRLSTVSETVTSLLSCLRRLMACGFSSPLSSVRKMTALSAASSWKATPRILSSSEGRSRSMPTSRWNSLAMRSFS